MKDLTCMTPVDTRLRRIKIIQPALSGATAPVPDYHDGVLTQSAVADHNRKMTP
jgi:hypothetical protein